MPVANAIVGSSVVSYFITGPLCCLRHCCHQHHQEDYEGPGGPGKPNCINLLSMAVIPQSTSVATRRAYARFTNCFLCVFIFSYSLLCPFHFSLYFFPHCASVQFQCFLKNIFISYHINGTILIWCWPAGSVLSRCACRNVTEVHPSSVFYMRTRRF